LSDRHELHKSDRPHSVILILPRARQLLGIQVFYIENMQRHLLHSRSDLQYTSHNNRVPYCFRKVFVALPPLPSTSQLWRCCGICISVLRFPRGFTVYILQLSSRECNFSDLLFSGNYLVKPHLIETDYRCSYVICCQWGLLLKRFLEYVIASD
jgi:hypothetical protein